MKRAISILLAVIITAGIVCPSALAKTAAEEELRFVVASDLHYTLAREQLEGDIDDDIYWYANRRAAMEDESSWIIDEFLRQCAENDECDYVLITGDIADSGRTVLQQHTDMAAKFAEFERTTGKQVFVINGNHDLGDGSVTDAAKFKEIYADFGYNEALVKDEKSCSYTADLGNRYRLIALDSCDFNRSTGDGMNSDKINWVVAQAKQSKADGRYPILIMHHNLLDHMPLQAIFSKNFIIRNHLTTANMFADSGIRLAFSGHEHCSDAATHTSPAGNTIFDFATTALTMYPLQYRQFVLTDSTISYNAKTVDSIDTAALTRAVDGYTSEQTELMNAGLNSYAKGFLKAGIEYRLSLSLSMEKIGIGEGEPFYNLVNTAVTGLTDILEMPLYGEGSVKELAAQYNIDIPDSSYENGWDLATDLVAAHYEGGESLQLDSTEVTVLLRIAALILRDDLAKIGDEVLLSQANSLLSYFGTNTIAKDLTKIGTAVFGPVTAGEYFILALASPIIYNFAYDSDGVDDNNGTFEGYGAAEANSNLTAVAAKLQNATSKFFLYLSMFFSIIFKIIAI